MRLHTLFEFTAWTGGSIRLTGPLFTDPENGDYTPAECSPAINRGNNDYTAVETDLAGNPRVGRAIVNLGAYEHQGVSTPS
ncbi:MAG: choice-of-anchor Q domain-containing protein [Thermoguttaceae bacterium]